MRSYRPGLDSPDEREPLKKFEDAISGVRRLADDGVADNPDSIDPRTWDFDPEPVTGFDIPAEPHPEEPTRTAGFPLFASQRTDDQAAFAHPRRSGRTALLATGAAGLAIVAALGAVPAARDAARDALSGTLSWSAAAGVMQTVLDRTTGVREEPAAVPVPPDNVGRITLASIENMSDAGIVVAQAVTPPPAARAWTDETVDAIVSSVEPPPSVVMSARTGVATDSLDATSPIEQRNSRQAEAAAPAAQVYLSPLPSIDLDQDLVAAEGETASTSTLAQAAPGGPPRSVAPAPAESTRPEPVRGPAPVQELAAIDATAPAAGAAALPSLAGPPPSPQAGPIAPNIIAERIAEMAEALAAERKAALERERDRADALARELAQMREELGSLRTAAVPSWKNLRAPTLPLVAPGGQGADEPPASPPLAAHPNGAEPQQAPQAVAQAPRPAAAPTAEPVRTPSIVDPPAPTAPARISATLERRLLDRADVLLKDRDISAARLILERGANDGSGRALFLLAQTYDPVMLNRWHILGVMGDRAKAHDLYTKAAASGIAEAAQSARDMQAMSR